MSPAASLPVEATCPCSNSTQNATRCDACAINQNRVRMGLAPWDHATKNGKTCPVCFPNGGASQ